MLYVVPKLRPVAVSLLAMTLSASLLAAAVPSAVSSEVELAKAAGGSFATVDMFSNSEGLDAIHYQKQWQSFEGVLEVLADGILTHPDGSMLKAVREQAPETLTLNLPMSMSKRGAFEIELVRDGIFSPDFEVVSDWESDTSHLDLGVHYRGVIVGEERSVAAISFFSNEVMGLIQSEELGTVVVGRLSGDNVDHRHVIYKRDDLALPGHYSCGNEKSGGLYGQGFDPILTTSDFELNQEIAPEPVAAKTTKAASRVDIYIETAKNMRQTLGSTQAVVNYSTGLFNQMRTLYRNDNVRIRMSQVRVTGRYGKRKFGNSDNMLPEFQRKSRTFNGDLGQAWRFTNGNNDSDGQAAVAGPGAGGTGLCSSRPTNKHSVAIMKQNYSPVPTYSDTVVLITHELGHSFGSRHTHACVWNGNNTAIDGCDRTEGSCSRPGVPAEGGTIMSYCDIRGHFVDLNNGFGPQPSATIRANVANANCL